MNTKDYLIDTGDEVILVDTGFPAGTPEEVPDETSMGFTGKDICSYMEAFSKLGYKPEQVTKILLTHKHTDHSGELKYDGWRDISERLWYHIRQRRNCTGGKG